MLGSTMLVTALVRIFLLSSLVAKVIYSFSPTSDGWLTRLSKTRSPSCFKSCGSNDDECNGTLPVQQGQGSSRRFFFHHAIRGISAAVVSNTMFQSASFAEEVNNLKLTDVYFGVGCFWHIQHEFVEAERRLLNRSDNELTSLTGYAGGTKLGDQGRVCYHNAQFLADYGRLGHGEVVGMKIPEASIGDFAKEYFSLFSPTNERVDPGDVGPEYRSLLGLPGGVHHPSYSLIEEAATSRGLKLVEGKGNDPDTLRKKIVYVMDSNRFPFYQAEVYHQFHNDFQSPPYGKQYNSLAKLSFADGKIKETGCPDRLPL